MNNSKRICALAKYALGFDSLVDVGADHGYLGIMAHLVYCVPKVLLTDISKEPLKVAKDNLKRNNLYGRIRVKEGNGLEPIDEQYDVLNISGMGGQLIKEIISSDIEKLNTFKRLILCPNRDSYEVRKFLNTNNFEIVAEEIIYDKKFYEVIVAEPKDKVQTLNELELRYGPLNLKEKSENFRALYSGRRSLLAKRIDESSEAGKADLTKKIKELDKILKK